MKQPKQKTITIEVRDGCVSMVRQSKGTTLIVRDFDSQELDNKGRPYKELRYEYPAKP